VSSNLEIYQRIARFLTGSICLSDTDATARSEACCSMVSRARSSCRRRNWSKSAFYPASATVVGIDISPAMLPRSDIRRKTSAAEPCVQQLDVTGLDFPDSSFDAAVARLSVLRCRMPNSRPAAGARQGRKGWWCHPPPGICPSARDLSADSREVLGALDRMGPRGELPLADRKACSKVGLELVEAHFVVPDLIKLISARAATRGCHGSTNEPA